MRRDLVPVRRPLSFVTVMSLLPEPLVLGRLRIELVDLKGDLDLGCPGWDVGELNH
jgi:hypothetical protein